MIRKKITRMDQKLLAHVYIQVFPNLRQQYRWVGNDEGDENCDIEKTRSFSGRLTRLSFPHREVLMIKRVQAKVVRKVFGSEHEPERNSAEQIVSFCRRNIPRVCLLGPQIKVERKEHEEDEQRVFLAYAIKRNGVYSASPERSRYQSGPAIEE